VVNSLNAPPPRGFWADLADYAVSTPATIAALLPGVALVVIGFRIRPYRL
jgi:hypothetical protein